MATSASSAIAAMVARARHEIREHFDRNQAFDPAHAVAYDPPSRIHRRQFDLLVGRGIVRQAGEGLYWLDRDAERLDEERRRQGALLLFKIILIGTAIAIAVVAILKAAH